MTLTILAVLSWALLTGSFVYCILTVIAARDYLHVKQPERPEVLPPISILTPLAGAEEGLAENLRSSFRQDYPEFEIVYAVRNADDAGGPIARRVMAEFPHIPAQIIVTGEPPFANAKVFSLTQMTAAARHELMVMNDSDIRSAPDMLLTIAAEFKDPSVGLATCPYRAVPGDGWFARMEALEMNTHFLGGVLVARMLEGMKFALGPSAVVRRGALERIGGWQTLGSYLAEDFELGRRIFENGERVILSSCRVEHHIGNAGPAANFSHRLRWVRSTRRSRPKGYVGEVFTNPVPAALLLGLVKLVAWPWVLAALLFRAMSVWAVAGWVLRDPLTRRLSWALPIQDMATFLVWVAGFFGNTVHWRGRTYYLHRDGRFELVH